MIISEMIRGLLIFLFGSRTCMVYEMHREWPWPSDGVACMAVSRDVGRAISLRVFKTWETAYFDSCWFHALHGEGN